MLDANIRRLGRKFTRHRSAVRPLHPALLNVQTDPRFLNEKRRVEVFP